MASQFDVIILGGGPAGYVAAIRSAQLGMTTAVIERDKLGGVCVNIGCIPTKALLHSAYIAKLLREAKEFGVEAGSVKTDYGVAMQRSRRVSDQNSKGVEFLMKKNKVTVVPKALKISANSMPTAPAPMIASVAGAFSRNSASSEEMTVVLLISNPICGRPFTRDPVAMTTAFFAS